MLRIRMTESRLVVANLGLHGKWLLKRCLCVFTVTFSFTQLKQISNKPHFCTALNFFVYERSDLVSAMWNGHYCYVAFMKQLTVACVAVGKL